MFSPIRASEAVRDLSPAARFATFVSSVPHRRTPVSGVPPGVAQGETSEGWQRAADVIAPAAVWESTGSPCIALLAPRRAKSQSPTGRRARSHGDVPAAKGIAKCLAGAEDDKNVPTVREG
jgi:hypothetical protein